MKSIQITMVGMLTSKETPELINCKIGDEVIFEEDPTNPKDPNAIKIKTKKGDLLGFVASSPLRVQFGTINVAEFKTYIAKEKYTGILRAEISSSNTKMISYICEAIPFVEPTKKNNTAAKKIAARKKKEVKPDLVSFVLRGTTVEYPERNIALQRVTAGEKIMVRMAIVDEKVLCLMDGIAIGAVKIESERYDDLLKVLEGREIMGKIAKFKANSIEVSADLNNSNSVFSEEMDRIIDNDICTEESMKCRVKYLKSIKIADQDILTIFAKIKKYPDKYKDRMITPKVYFIDDGGYVAKSLEYLDLGSYLRYVGDKATGKNTLTENLAWIYAVPLFEVAVNEELDKVDLLGSRVIDTDDNGNMKMPYEIAPLVEGLEVGGLIVIDEVNIGRASILTILHGVDQRKRIEVPGYGTVNIHEDARIILTMNEDYCGTTDINEATVDRFVPIIFENPNDISMVLKGIYPEARKEKLDNCQKVYSELRRLNADGHISTFAISIRGFISAMKVRNFKEGLIDNIANKGENRVERESIKRVIESLIA